MCASGRKADGFGEEVGKEEAHMIGLVFFLATLALQHCSMLSTSIFINFGITFHPFIVRSWCVLFNN